MPTATPQPCHILASPSLPEVVSLLGSGPGSTLQGLRSTWVQPCLLVLSIQCVPSSRSQGDTQALNVPTCEAVGVDRGDLPKYANNSEEHHGTLRRGRSQWVEEKGASAVWGTDPSNREPEMGQVHMDLPP